MKRTVATLSLGALLATSLAVGTGTTMAEARVQTDAPGYCGRFGEYYQATFAVGLLSAFAKTFAPEGQKAKAADARNILRLLFSPKLEPIVEELATSAPRATRPFFAVQVKVYAKGIALWKGLGLTDEQLDQLAQADLEVSSDSQEFTDVFGVTRAQVFAAGRKLGKEIDKTRAAVNPSRRQGAALERLGVNCGTVPDSSIDCATLVPDAQVESLIGKVDEAEGSCKWTGVEPEQGLAPKLAVELYRSAAAFDERFSSLVERATAVAGVGDQAVVTDGFSSATSGSSCGRTILVRAGDATLLVALCPTGEAEVADAQLVQLAADILGRVDDAGGG